MSGAVTDSDISLLYLPTLRHGGVRRGCHQWPIKYATSGFRAKQIARVLMCKIQSGNQTIMNPKKVGDGLQPLQGSYKVSTYLLQNLKPAKRKSTHHGRCLS